MNRLNMTLIVVGTLCVSCASKVTANRELSAAEPDQVDDRRTSDAMQAEEMGIAHVRNSHITARVLEIGLEESREHHCEYEPCLASVEIEAVDNGSNYHGQYHVGDTIVVHFDFSLLRSDSLYPELNQPLPGLDVLDRFHAELFERVGGIPSYRVKLYEKLER